MTELGTAAQPATPPAAGTPSAGHVEIELVHTERGARMAVEVLGQVWRRDDGELPMPPELAWAFAHSGNYVALAHHDGRPVGAAIGFRGADESGVLLHSHIAGVVPPLQGAHVGYALKQHQREWALSQGINRMTWTFDPLVARNAYFNVTKLGARVAAYYVDFYGALDDGINGGDETDRCLIEWDLRAPRTNLPVAPYDAPVALAPGNDGAPRIHATAATSRLLRLPPDIVELRQRQPALARRWRLALREALQAAFRDGLEIVAVSRDSSYLLARPGETSN